MPIRAHQQLFESGDAHLVGGMVVDNDLRVVSTELGPHSVRQGGSQESALLSSIII